MILVTGDIVLNHNIYEGKRLTPNDRKQSGSQFLEIPGGALLTFGVLEKLLGNVVQFGLAQTSLSSLRRWPQQFHTRSTWHLVPNGKDQKDGQHWALNQYLGYGDSQDKPYPASLAPNLPKPPSILVLDDADLGFREAKHCWPDCLQSDTPPDGLEWVVLKTSMPLADGSLWERIKGEQWRDKVVLIVTVEQLRNEGLRVAGGLSWETTVSDIVRELESNPDLRPLTTCRHLIITIGGDAALWVYSEPNQAVCRQLIFDRVRCEGEWAENSLHKNWKAYGYLSAITASIAWSLWTVSQKNRMALKKDPGAKLLIPDDFTIALAAGLSTARFLRKEGHGVEGQKPAMPISAAADYLKLEASKYFTGKPVHSYASTGLEGLQRKNWAQFTILGQVFGSDGGEAPVSYEPARRVARFGPEKLRGVPCASFEKLRTMDRREIDSLRYLRQLMLAYHVGGVKKRPLCLAVFGAPGSGKSFGLKQIAEAVFSAKNPILEFNLSQYTGPSDLLGAYHQVRDKVLQGFTPVVFWDEFDSNDLNWLQYFLAPMQDGTFQQGEVTHTIGKCVFVFAGGTSYTFESFRKPTDLGKFRMRKGPDFISRLAGFLDIAGPNQRLMPDGLIKDSADREFPIRRALLMRGALELRSDETLRIESSLLNALLAVTHYCNGARSLEKLVTAIRERGGIPLRRAHLPPDEILGLYVDDVAEFHRLMDRFHDKAETLAPLIHAHYLKTLTVSQKSEYGGRPLAKAWDDSDAEITDPNIMAALRIPDVLAAAGYGLVEGTEGDDAVLDFPASDLELMAEIEHRGWEESKRIEGWSYWRWRNNEALRHPLLKPYKELSDADKSLDRASIREYPKHARSVGYRIVKIP